MRQRFFASLANNGRYPETDGGRNLPPFNWVKIDNRGANPVVVGLGGQVANDAMDYYAIVAAGDVRVFNVGPPRANHDIDPVHPDPEMGASTDTWAHELHLLAPSGATTVVVDIADYPLVDISRLTSAAASAAGSPLASVRLQDGVGSPLATVSAGDLPDAFSVTGVQISFASMRAFNGANWDRVRDASAAALATQSGLGAILAAPPGQWSVQNSPAVSARATISQAAGGAGVRNVCTGFGFGFSAGVAVAATVVTVNLRDGATGAGAILKSWSYSLPAAIVAPFGIEVAGVEIPGTAATAMTLEFTALLANLVEYVNLGGHLAS